MPVRWRECALWEHGITRSLTTTTARVTSGSAVFLRRDTRRIGAVLPRGVGGTFGLRLYRGLVSAFRPKRDRRGFARFAYRDGGKTRILDTEAWEVRNWFKQYEPDAILTTDPSNLSRILAGPRTVRPFTAHLFARLHRFPGLLRGG